MPVLGTHAHEVLFVIRSKHGVNKSTKMFHRLLYTVEMTSTF